MVICKATDAHAVLEFYHDLIDKMKDRPIRPTWTKGFTLFSATCRRRLTQAIFMSPWNLELSAR